MGVEALTTGNQSPPSPPAIRANRQGLAEPPIRSERGRAAIVGLQTLDSNSRRQSRRDDTAHWWPTTLVFLGAPEPGFTSASSRRLGISVVQTGP